VNRVRRPDAEQVERKGGAKENGARTARPGHEPDGASHGLERVRQAARLKKENGSRASAPRRCRPGSGTPIRAEARSGPGVDGMTWQDYGQDLEVRLEDAGRVHRELPAQPSRVVHPKPDGRQAPARIAALGGQIVRAASPGVKRSTRKTSSGSRTGSGGAQPARRAGCPGGRIDRTAVTGCWTRHRGVLRPVSHEWLVRFVDIGSATGG